VDLAAQRSGYCEALQLLYSVPSAESIPTHRNNYGGFPDSQRGHHRLEERIQANQDPLQLDGDLLFLYSSDDSHLISLLAYR
jgi:hypothetical protein